MGMAKFRSKRILKEKREAEKRRMESRRNSVPDSIADVVEVEFIDVLLEQAESAHKQDATRIITTAQTKYECYHGKHWYYKPIEQMAVILKHWKLLHKQKSKYVDFDALKSRLWAGLCDVWQQVHYRKAVKNYQAHGHILGADVPALPPAKKPKRRKRA